MAIVFKDVPPTAFSAPTWETPVLLSERISFTISIIKMHGNFNYF